MKAKVQYNDFVGSAAADISDYYHNSINDYLQKHYPEFEWERYYCIGCEFFASYGQYPSVHFICKDLNDSKYYRLTPEDGLSLEEFFELFKRFSIVVGNGIENIEVESREDVLIR
ncbi:MAG: hypothetical protein J6M41_01785 [Prevotella sp.]|nr:hypothetical protein [Prevotella sp.]